MTSQWNHKRISIHTWEEEIASASSEVWHAEHEYTVERVGKLRLVGHCQQQGQEY